MTTRYEHELQDIEHRLKVPIKSAKVSPGEKIHLEEQRRREKLRMQLTREIGQTITCEWLDKDQLDDKGQPKKWEVARASVTFGKITDIVDIDPWEEVEGKRRLKSAIVKEGYVPSVEKWALWKWNTARGAESDDHDRYIMDCDPPVFEWVNGSNA